MKRYYLLIILVQLCILFVYGQEKKLTFTLEKKHTKFVNVDSLNYDNFIIEFINTSHPNIKDFNIVEKRGRFDLKLIEKKENSVSYRVTPVKKKVGKHLLILLLKTKDTTKFLTEVLFYKNRIDLNHIKTDSIVELEHLNHPPIFRAHRLWHSDYKLKGLKENSIMPISTLNRLSYMLSLSPIGDYQLYANDRLRCTFRIIPPLILGRGNKMDTEIISTDFKKKDSLSIEIHYSERVNRINSYHGSVNITVDKGRFEFSHESDNVKRKSTTFKGIDKGILDHLTVLEVKGKETPVCENNNLDGTFVFLIINGKETVFEFCSEPWDGVKEFIDHITKMKINEEKK